jgi:2-hydroxy-3-oxopropionate reductase
MQGPIGFIGLGIMGRPMAKNLLKAGYSVIVHNRSQAAVQELTGLGAKAGGSPAGVAREAQIVILMLPNSPDVELVALGPHGLMEGAQSGQTVVDMSTISPIVSKKVGAALTTKGVRMLDAPVSGGEKGAIEGILSIMVGGDPGVFQLVLPVFQAMGKTITHLGLLGSGGFTKLANQIIVAVNLTALAEALTLAAKAGLDIELTLKALGGGLAGSRCLDQKTPNYLAHEFKPGFKIDLHYKDLGLIADAARALGVPLPATAVVQELFSAARAKGRGQLDHSGIVTVLEDLAGTQVKKHA